MNMVMEEGDVDMEANITMQQDSVSIRTNSSWRKEVNLIFQVPN
jgi:hypothetical protein